MARRRIVMVNVISVKKAKEFSNRAFLANVNYMRERVAVMNAEDSRKEELKVITTPVNQDTKSKSERS